MQWNKPSDSCGSVGPQLWDYVAGSLPAGGADAARIKAHLDHCAPCRTLAEAFRASASALGQYTSSGAEIGIPSRAPNWEAVHMRLQQNQNKRQSETSVSGVPWLRALRTRPAFAGATVACGLCTALCAVAIPLAVGQRNQEIHAQISLGGVPSAAVSVSAVPAVPAVPKGPKAPVELEVQPVFRTTGSPSVNMGESQTLPLIALLTNNTGKPITVQLSAADRGGFAADHYARSVSLTADFRPQVVKLYPSLHGANAYYNQYHELRVVLTGPVPSQEAILPYQVPSYSEEARMGLISDARFGSLLPKQQVIEELKRLRKARPGRAGAENRQYIVYSSGFARPEWAPERPIGYSGINTLVLARGAAKLTDVQRSALRQWVIGGGSVILLPGATLDLLGIKPDAPFTTARPVGHLLPPSTPLRRYRLGVGTILTVPVDLTQEAFREKEELPFLWDDLRSRAAPTVPTTTLSSVGSYFEFGGGTTGSNDPFQIALPPLTSVVYLFAGYFLLAVPITFVVLKQTRRMNWAWATGPILAVLFGGAVYGFTADLHKAKLSRRTGGVLISTAGEKEARFIGTSEMFFPSAGRYDVTVPNAETMGLGLESPYYSEENRQTSPNDGNGLALHSLEAEDNGTSVTVPGLSVPNLAFRRLQYAQPAAWGEGITADLMQTADGRVIGTIRNGTGRTLTNAYILPQTAVRRREVQNKRYTRSCPNMALVGRVAPGVTVVNQKITVMDSADTAFAALPGGTTMLYHSRLLYHAGASPVLIGTTSGENLGPTIGQYVGGAVTVAVTLPPIPKTNNSAAQGGLK